MNHVTTVRPLTPKPTPSPLLSHQILVWKELNYGHMREKEKQLVVSEVSEPDTCFLYNHSPNSRHQVNILRELRHPFIVRYYDRIIDKATTKLYIVMEHCEGGDLGRVIKKCKKERCGLSRCPERHQTGHHLQPVTHQSSIPIIQPPGPFWMSS